MDSPLAQGHPVTEQTFSMVRTNNGKQAVLQPRSTTRTNVQRVRAPAAASFVNSSVESSGKGRRIVGEEPVLTTWSADTLYPIFPNPGDAMTYTLLSQEARFRMRYDVNKLRLSYRPSVPTTTTGEIGIGWISDPNTPVPTTLDQVLSLGIHAVGPAWSPLVIDIPKPKLKGGRLDYLVSQSADAEPALHAPGYFVMFSEVANSGRLMLAYDFNLKGRNPYPLDLTLSNNLIPLNGAMFGKDTSTTGAGANINLTDAAGCTSVTKSPYLRAASNGIGDTLYVLRPCLLRANFFTHCSNNDAVNPREVRILRRQKENGGAWANQVGFSGSDYLYNESLPASQEKREYHETFLVFTSDMDYPVEIGFAFYASTSVDLDHWNTVFQVVETS